MVLPQLPYFPLGSLRDALLYPESSLPEHGISCEEAMKLCGLQHLNSRLDEVKNWKMELSQGEQQRLAIARAIVQRPDWLFLDESTSALDEPMESQLYGLLRAHLPEAGLMSIGHRMSLIALHDRHLEVSPAAGRRTLTAISP